MSQPTSTCSACGADLALEVRFCPRCGAPQAAEPAAAEGWTCSLCGGSNAAELEACASCGGPRDVEPPRWERRSSDLNAEPVQLFGGFSLARPYAYVLGGLALSVVLHFLLCGIFDFGVQVFFHELGHAILSWAIGSPSVPLPMFGFAWSMPQSLLLALAIWGGLGYYAWTLREEARRWAIGLGVVTLLYPLIAFTGLGRALVSAGGHGGEVIFACWFFWRALEPHSDRFKEMDRALYAMMAWMLVLGNVGTFYRLLTSAAERHRYETESVLGVGNDFIHVSRYLGMRLTHVSLLFLVFITVAVGVTAASWWWLRWRHVEFVDAEG